MTILKTFLRARMAYGARTSTTFVTTLLRMLAVIDMTNSWANVAARHRREALNKAAAFRGEMTRLICLK